MLRAPCDELDLFKMSNNASCCEMLIILLDFIMQCKARLMGTKILSTLNSYLLKKIDGTEQIIQCKP